MIIIYAIKNNKSSINQKRCQEKTDCESINFIHTFLFGTYVYQIQNYCCLVQIGVPKIHLWNLSFPHSSMDHIQTHSTLYLDDNN